MGERKVLNKYIPADFDPRLVPRGKKPKDDLVTVRMMLPFSVQCSTCNTFLYKGRKFNSKKETVKGAAGKYLGIQRFRFYIKCTACSRPVTFLTDPENADYEMESGGTRTYEVNKDKARLEEDVEKEYAQKEKEDPMKALENRVLASQKEMADLDNLDEIKAMNMRHLRILSSNKGDGSIFRDDAVNGFKALTNAVLDAGNNNGKNTLPGDEDVNEHGLTAEEEAMVKTIKFGKQQPVQKKSNSSFFLHRIGDEEEEELERTRRKKEDLFERQQTEVVAKARLIAEQSTKPRMINSLIRIKRKRVDAETVANEAKVKLSSDTLDADNDDKNSDESSHDDGGGLENLLGAYGSDSD